MSFVSLVAKMVFVVCLRPTKSNTSNSYDISFLTCLHLSLKDFVTGVDIGHLLWFNLICKKTKMGISRTDDDLILAMILTHPKQHLGCV